MNITETCFVKLESEPCNPNDKHVIAVYVMSSSDYEKVGFIARERTQFLHPLIKDPALKVTGVVKASSKVK